MPKTNSKKLTLVSGNPAIVARAGTDDKYQILFDQASDAVMTLEKSKNTYKIDDVNIAFQELSGYLKNEIEDSDIEFLIPESKKNHIPERAKTLSRALFETPGTYEDVAILRKDGFVRLVDISVRLAKSGKSDLVIALLRDTTEKKRMERELITKHTELRNAYINQEKINTELKATQEMLVQAGKMAALGELAAGIAHELNQPLQGIRGYAQELQSVLGDKIANTNETAGFCTKEIISNVDKMAKIIQYLRTFTRKSTEEFEWADVHHAIEEALKMLSRQFASRGIMVEKKFAADLPKIYANALQLEQVFINLATNARDAIEATQRGKGLVSIQTSVKSKFVEIRFKDDGVGMADQTKRKIFNPFFTTKEVGKGMGLGLSLSYGILNKIHGSIVVESDPNKGAEFIIRLPRDYREIG